MQALITDNTDLYVRRYETKLFIRCRSHTRKDRVLHKEDKHNRSYKQVQNKPDKLVSALCFYSEISSETSNKLGFTVIFLTPSKTIPDSTSIRLSS